MGMVDSIPDGECYRCGKENTKVSSYENGAGEWICRDCVTGEDGMWFGWFDAATQEKKDMTTHTQYWCFRCRHLHKAGSEWLGIATGSKIYNEHLPGWAYDIQRKLPPLPYDATDVGICEFCGDLLTDHDEWMEHYRENHDAEWTVLHGGI